MYVSHEDRTSVPGVRSQRKVKLAPVRTVWQRRVPVLSVQGLSSIELTALHIVDLSLGVLVHSLVDRTTVLAVTRKLFLQLRESPPGEHKTGIIQGNLLRSSAPPSSNSSVRWRDSPHWFPALTK